MGGSNETYEEGPAKGMQRILPVRQELNTTRTPKEEKASNEVLIKSLAEIFHSDIKTLFKRTNNDPQVVASVRAFLHTLDIQVNFGAEGEELGQIKKQLIIDSLNLVTDKMRGRR
ncbi:MAG: hypothetical protein UT13_C0001G0611 [Candidatus Pacebacteria bacterium GW2011_GWF2_38_9]|nr:MAG: hypothetical protein US01_C0001G0629 [candidate division TM6 bacterium GW2011_GWF2_28_16]KKQ08705.1 MAG: hypothetical protein US20_C0013G0055 [Candidatus Pacebacteria bacterium GW2011_GWF1_36_5]KKQ88964.1 MAG: hypothetical protein UT13_C0001G0611 [Candidatus Pacebacteria bacterium GW2011_GWF2_38_9]HAZ73139.1 hypothetical protein [Candidatus Paceibacterota bacterium]